MYRDVDFPANIANTQLGWEREDLWPCQRGWDFPDNLDVWTDIYGKAPADSTVHVAKRSLFLDYVVQWKVKMPVSNRQHLKRHQRQNKMAKSLLHQIDTRVMWLEHYFILRHGTIRR